MPLRAWTRAIPSSSSAVTLAIPGPFRVCHGKTQRWWLFQTGIAHAFKYGMCDYSCGWCQPTDSTTYVANTAVYSVAIPDCNTPGECCSVPNGTGVYAGECDPAHLVLALVLCRCACADDLMFAQAMRPVVTCHSRMVSSVVICTHPTGSSTASATWHAATACRRETYA